MQKKLLFSSVYYLIYLHFALFRLALRICPFIYRSNAFVLQGKRVVGKENQQPHPRSVLIRINIRKEYV